MRCLSFILTNTSTFLYGCVGCRYIFFHKYNKFRFDDNNESYQTKIKEKKKWKKYSCTQHIYKYTL